MILWRGGGIFSRSIWSIPFEHKYRLQTISLFQYQFKKIYFEFFMTSSIINHEIISSFTEFKQTKTYQEIMHRFIIEQFQRIIEYICV